MGESEADTNDTDIVDAVDTGNRESRTKVLSTGTNDWVSFGKLFFVIASRSILFSVLAIFIPILYITVINGEASASSLALTAYFAMGAVLTYMGGITLGLGITLGGLVAPYVGHLADIYDVQTALMTLIPVGVIGLLMSFWLKEPK